MVIATNNKGKTEEIREFLKDFPVTLKNLDDFGPIPPVVEDGETFDDNAYKKSSHTARILGMPALADDSGLVVEALNGAPGVFSARYAGENAGDDELCNTLLNNMNGKSNRRAFFECVISIAVPAGPALTYEARCEGLITQQSVGDKGFGYDPVFYYPELKKTFGEMTLEEKGRVSHRGRALRELAGEFDKVLTWIRQHMPIPERFDCKE